MKTLNNCHIKTLSGVISTISLVVLFSLPSSVFGQAKVGTTGATFLEIGVSARGMGMAEAYIAAVNDITATYYNPAGLSYMQGGEAMLSYISLPADVTYGFVGAGLPLETIGGVLGFSAYGLNSGEIVRTTYENSYGNGTGQKFSSQDMAIGVSYGRYLTDRFSVGVTMRYISLNADATSTSGWSADIGTLYDTGYRGFKIGMVISNFGPDLRYIEKDFPLPINFKFGSTFNIVQSGDHIVTAAFEGAHPADNLEEYNGGMEYNYKNRYMLRVGQRFNYDLDGLTFGGGLRLPFGEQSEFRLDYAYQDMGILTEVHRFSFGVSF